MDKLFYIAFILSWAIAVLRISEWAAVILFGTIVALMVFEKIWVNKKAPIAQPTEDLSEIKNDVAKLKLALSYKEFKR